MIIDGFYHAAFDHVDVQGLHWLKSCFTLSPLASAEYQPKPDIKLPNNMTENGQTNVRER